jgi:hypothetical protein
MIFKAYRKYEREFFPSELYGESVVFIGFIIWAVCEYIAGKGLLFIRHSHQLIYSGTAFLVLAILWKVGASIAAFGMFNLQEKGIGKMSLLLMCEFELSPEHSGFWDWVKWSLLGVGSALAVVAFVAASILYHGKKLPWMQ